MKYEMEHCPFCGKRNAEVKRSANWGHFVSCRNCHAVGPSAGSRDGAVAGWNRRVEAEQPKLDFGGAE